MIDLEKCPFCDEEADQMLEARPGGWAVSCDSPRCGATGPVRKEQDDAIEAWNKLAEIRAWVRYTR